MRSRLLVLATALLLSLTACAAPKIALDPLLKAQVDAAAQVARTAERPMAVFVGAAMDGSSTAFVGDVRLAELQLRHQAPQLAVLRLANGAPKPADWPGASSASLRQALASAGALLPSDGRNARAVVLLSSHGGKGLLSLAATERDNAVADARQLEAWLEPLGRTPTLLIISACYSGSLIPALQQPNRIIITAAAANRASFGCDVDSSDTYFIEELFGSRFDADVPITEWFRQARQGVSAREKAMKLSPASNPQIWIADGMKPMAAQSLAAWLGGETPSR